MTTVARLLELPRRPRVVLDIKGLLTHSYFSGKDTDQVRDDAGERANSAGYGLHVFFDRYFKPILEGFAPMDVIAVWDGGNNYRKQLFPGYKKSRSAEKKGKQLLEEQQIKILMDSAKRLFAYLGAINVQVNGVEADDLIALIVDKLPGNIMLYTVDQDLMQLASDRVVVSFRDQFEEDQKHKGVEAEFIPLYKSIVGDTSDEYPGVKGMGPKAWEKLIEIYGEGIQGELKQAVETKDFTSLKDAADEYDCKLLKTIYEQRLDWQLMYNLACLHPELCYGMKRGEKIEPKFYTRWPCREAVADVFEKTGCRHLMQDVDRYLPVEFVLADMDRYEEATGHLLSNLSKSPAVSFDFETYDSLKHEPFVAALSDKAKENGYVDVLSSIPTGGSFTYGSNLQYTFYVPEMHRDTKNVDDGVAAILRHLVGEWKGAVICHNASFEEQIAKQNYRVQFERLVDPMIMASYVDENERFGLKSLTKRLFNYDQQSYKELLSAAGAEDMRGLSGAEVLHYGCDDAIMAAHLWKLFDLITTLESCSSFYYENETSPVHILNRGFEAGVAIDFDRMEELAELDKQTAHDGMVFIREQLQINCNEIREEHAKAFFEADREAARGKLLVKAEINKWSKDEVRLKLDEIRKGMVIKTIYRPLVAVKKEVEFSPTPVQVKKVVSALWSTLPEGVELKSLSSSAITTFLMAVEPTTDMQEKFCELIAQAAKFLTRYKENAEVCQPFVDFCKEVLSADAKEELIGDELNFGSPNQMQEFFYLKLGLPVRERTKKAKGSFRDVNGFPGSPATNEVAVMTALLHDCPEGDWRRDVLKRLLDVKEAMTRESLYYKPYPLWVHPRDGVIHPSVRNCATTTRRPAGGSPNILQVSKGPTRSIFIPRYTGHCLISIDFSGQELRLTGSESKDPVLIDCYTGGGTWTDEDGMIHPVVRDVHSVTSCAFATEIVTREIEKKATDILLLDERGFVDYGFFRKLLNHDVKVNGELPEFGDLTAKLAKAFNSTRKMAKVVNFLLIYGGDYHTLAKKLGIGEDFAERLMNLVFKTYKRLEPWQKETIAFAEKNGYVCTAYGSRRHVSDNIVSRDDSAKSRMERQAVNATIQGCAADILKKVLNSAYETNLFTELDSILYAPVYDETVSSVPIHHAVEYCFRMQELMNITPPGHPIPMMGEVSIGRNWHEQEELGDMPSERKIEAAIERAFS